MNVLVGGVGQLYQGDLDLGRRAVDCLGAEDLGPHVLIEELHYGAVAVAQRLEELHPAALVLVGAASRGRPAGAVERRRVTPRERPAADVHHAVTDAVTGFVTLDLVVEVASGFGVLPARTVTVEVEPDVIAPSDRLSPAGEAGLEAALELVRTEVRRVPLLGLADRLRTALTDGHIEDCPALDAMEDLLGSLDVLDREGRWAGAFHARDRLRMWISQRETGEGMQQLDWGLWWGLIEELDRLQPLESTG